MKQDQYNEKWLQECSSDYVFYKRDHSESLIICSSGLGRLVLWDFYKTITEKISQNNADVGFLNDRSSMLYMKGVLGFSKSHNDTAEKFNSIIKERQHKRVFFIGTSVGAYANMVHALLLKMLSPKPLQKIKLICFNPIVNATQFDFYKKIENQLSEKEKRYADVRTLFTMADRQGGAKVEMCIHHGNSSSDITQANLLKRLSLGSNTISLKFIKHELTGHNLAGNLKKKGVLVSIIKSFLEP